jgi:hypothetical protein
MRARGSAVAQAVRRGGGRGSGRGNAAAPLGERIGGGGGWRSGVGRERGRWLAVLAREEATWAWLVVEDEARGDVARAGERPCTGIGQGKEGRARWAAGARGVGQESWARTGCVGRAQATGEGRGWASRRCWAAGRPR